MVEAVGVSDLVLHETRQTTHGEVRGRSNRDHDRFTLASSDATDLGTPSRALRGSHHDDALVLTNAERTEGLAKESAKVLRAVPGAVVKIERGPSRDPARSQ